MMGNIGSGEVLVVLVLGLLILGPERLPDFARKIGSFLNSFTLSKSMFLIIGRYLLLLFFASLKLLSHFFRYFLLIGLV